ncbi:MAG: DinB family protein [Planctomycetota bacterium]|nr:DinB family protein [Planctomycetota bacterium]
MTTDGDTRALHAALNRLGEALRWPEDRLYAVAPGVSQWSPAQHVQHALIALRRIFAAVTQLQGGEGEAIQPRGAPTLQGRALLLGGWIPRGKADAPDFAVPDDIPSRAAMLDVHERACARYAEIAPVAGALRSVPGVIEHQVLKGLSASQWWRFARIHTEHHLAIIDDVDRHRVVTDPIADPADPIGEVP